MIFSQNLIKNSSFEEYDTLFSNVHSSGSPNFQHLKHWDKFGWQAFYCNCKIGKTNNDWYLSTCVNKATAHSGCGMVKLIYEPRCPIGNSSGNDIVYSGCTAYIITKLNSPLAPNKIYEASMWVYLPQTEKNGEWLSSNIGMVFSKDKIKDPGPKSIIYFENFISDSIPFNQWFNIKKYFKPECNINYLTIGLFRKGKKQVDVKYWDQSYPTFYIDDVTVFESKSPSEQINLFKSNFCDIVKLVTLESKSTNSDILVHFDIDDYNLTSTEIHFIDENLTLKNKYKYIIKITGYTDNTGSENDLLSKNRAKEVEKYIMAKYNYPDFQILSIGKGCNAPIDNNNTELGRKLNRRASIEFTNIPVTKGIYYKILLLVKNKQFEKSIKYILLWLSKTSQENKILLLFDPRIKELRNLAGWKNIYIEIKKSYNVFKNPELAFTLDSMHFEDQKYRTLESALGFMTPNESDMTKLNDELSILTLDINKLSFYDSINFRKLKTYLGKDDFLKKSLVGASISRNMVYLLIHQLPNKELESFESKIMNLCLKNENDWDCYAMFVDRLLRCKNKPQKYATQFEFIDSTKSELKLAPIDNIDSVNYRRTKVGLNKIEPELLNEITKLKH